MCIMLSLQNYGDKMRTKITLFLMTLIMFSSGITMLSASDTSSMDEQYIEAMNLLEPELTDSFIRKYGPQYTERYGDYTESKIVGLANMTMQKYRRSLDTDDCTDEDLDKLELYCENILDWKLLINDYGGSLKGVYNNTISSIEFKRDRLEYQRAKKLEKMDEDAYDVASKAGTIEAYQKYLADFPVGCRRNSAEYAIEDIKKNQEKAKKLAQQEQLLKDKRSALGNYAKNFKMEGTNDEFLDQDICIRDIGEGASDFGNSVRYLIGMIAYIDGKILNGKTVATKYFVSDDNKVNLSLYIEDLKLTYIFNFQDNGYVSSIDTQANTNKFTATTYEEKYRTLFTLSKMVVETVENN